MIPLYSRLFLIVGFVGLAGCSVQKSKAPRAGFFSPQGWKTPIASKREIPAKNKNVIASYDSNPKAQTSVPAKRFSQPTEQMNGFASWYGPGFHGKQTANGETYNQMGMTAAHRYLPINTWLKVTNLENGKSIVVRVNDRGPYKKNRVLDLTKRAAKKLGFFDQGTARVELEVLKYPKNFDSKKGLKAYRQVVVQLAVFKTKDRASDYAEELHRRFTRLDFMIDQPREGVYHVVLGPYQKRAEAKQIGESLNRDGVESFVRSYRK